MPTKLKQNDILTRFLITRSDFNSDSKLKASAFAGKHPDGFSTFETTGQSEDEIKQVFYDHVFQSEEKTPLRARHDLAYEHYENAGLSVVLKEPPPRHYEIYGFPISAEIDRIKGTSARMFLASLAKVTIYFPL